MRRFGGWADPESYVVMKRKTCFFPGWVGCINILMVSQFYPHFPARLRLHRGACPQSMREWLCCSHAGCNILDRYNVVPVDHKSLSKPVLFLVPSPTVYFCESMEVQHSSGTKFSTQAACRAVWLGAHVRGATRSRVISCAGDVPNQVQESSARKGHWKH